MPPAKPTFARRFPLITATLAAALLLVFVPLNDPPSRIADRLLVVEMLGWVLASGYLLARSPALCWVDDLARQAASAHPAKTAAVAPAAILLVWIAILWVWLWWPRFAEARLADDDLIYVLESLTWHDAWANLLRPYNEHFLVPARLWTWLLCQLADEARRPWVLVAGSGILFVGTWPLIYAAIAREADSPALGVLAVQFFALTTAHREVVEWYAASQWLFAVYPIAGGILAVQCPTAPGWRRLAAACLCAAVGPLCYWVGALTGPLTSVYLWSHRRANWRAKDLAIWLAPTAATATAALVLFRLAATAATERGQNTVTAEQVAAAVAAERVDSKRNSRHELPPALFHPDKNVEAGSSSVPAAELARNAAGRWRRLNGTDLQRAALFAARFATDRLLLNNLGLPLRWRGWLGGHAVWFGGFAIVTLWLLRDRAERGRLAFGWAAIVLGYAIVFPFRTQIPYERGLLVNARYQLVPQVGFVWLIAIGLARHQIAWLSGPRLDCRVALALAAAAALLFVLRSEQL
jgi:hypothetical protein